MKRVKITRLNGSTAGAEMEDPSAWIAQCVASNAWGKPERYVLHKDEPMAEPYDEADVLEEKIVVDAEAIPEVLDESGAIIQEAIPAKSHKEVKLRAEYSIKIEDITAEHELVECLRKRKLEYPTPEEFMNAFFDGGDQALQDLRDLRLLIKGKYPKPGVN